jgi:hypothetical protein
MLGERFLVEMAEALGPAVGVAAIRPIEWRSQALWGDENGVVPTEEGEDMETVASPESGIVVGDEEDENLLFDEGESA